MPEVSESVLIPGSFDILSPDHRSFISACMAALATEVSTENVVIGLVPDRALKAKGKYRPFFSSEWRQEDIRDWFATVEPDQRIGFEEFYPGKILRSPPREQKYSLAALSVEYVGTSIAAATARMAERTIFVPPVNDTHTSDIERTLRAERDSSSCEWRVGAVLLRNGSVAGQYHNGGLMPDSCLSCSKRIDVQMTAEEIGVLQPSLVPCDFSHAELQAVREAEPGDYLLSTLSPCWGCAEDIAVSGIERVVYLKPYHTTVAPIEYLASSGVQVRQAGYHADAD